MRRSRTLIGFTFAMSLLGAGARDASSSEIQGSLFSLPEAAGGVQSLSGITVKIQVLDTNGDAIVFDDLSDPTSPKLGVTEASTDTGAFKIRVADRVPASTVPRLATLTFARAGNAITQVVAKSPVAFRDGVLTYQIDLTVPESPLVPHVHTHVCGHHHAIKRSFFFHR